jgi:hypothetical protein
MEGYGDVVDGMEVDCEFGDFACFWSSRVFAEKSNTGCVFLSSLLTFG